MTNVHSKTMFSEGLSVSNPDILIASTKNGSLVLLLELISIDWIIKKVGEVGPQIQLIVYDV